jgi:hypothetical protein
MKTIIFSHMRWRLEVRWRYDGVELLGFDGSTGQYFTLTLEDEERQDLAKFLLLEDVEREA